jgi:hypothetical protein
MDADVGDFANACTIDPHLGGGDATIIDVAGMIVCPAFSTPRRPCS